MHGSVTNRDRVCLHPVLLLAGGVAVVDALVVRQGVGGGFAGRLGGCTLEALTPVSDTIPR